MATQTQHSQDDNSLQACQVSLGTIGGVSPSVLTKIAMQMTPEQRDAYIKCFDPDGLNLRDQIKQAVDRQNSDAEMKQRGERFDDPLAVPKE